MNPEDVQAAFAATLVDEWHRAGVAHAVVAPGSRSTPILVALQADGRIGLHVVIDERSACFVALGMGVSSGVPAVVVTTSGTAAAELHPGVVEAHQAGVPLVAVTADRPPELHGVGAPQTIDQEQLFVGALRYFASPGVPEASGRGWWRSLAARSVAEAVSGPRGPGPVHLNLAFREPLLPTDRAAATRLVPDGRPGGRPWHAVGRPRSGRVGGFGAAGAGAGGGAGAHGVGGVGSLAGAAAGGLAGAGDGGRATDVMARLAGAGERGLIVAGAGAGDAEAIWRLAATTGWPVLADPPSGARWPRRGVVAAADSLLRVPLVAGWEPDVVIRLGRPWASKVVAQWLASCPATYQVLVDPWGRWGDPDRRADAVVAADPEWFCIALAGAVEAGRGAGGGGEEVAGGSGGGGGVGGAGGSGGGGEGGAGAGGGGWAQRWATAEGAAQSAIDGLIAGGRPYDLDAGLPPVQPDPRSPLHGPTPGRRPLTEPVLARRLVAALPHGATLVTSSSMPVRDVEWFAVPRRGVRFLANRGANGIDGVVSTAIGTAAAGKSPTYALVGDLAFFYDAGALLAAVRHPIDLTAVVVDNSGGGIFSFLPQAAALAENDFERLWGTPPGLDPAAVAAAYGARVVVASAADEVAAAVSGAPAGLTVVVARVAQRAANVRAHQQLNQAVAEAVVSALG